MPESKFSSKPKTPGQKNMLMLPTLIDRLTDDEPSKKQETPEAYAVSQKRMKEILQRDLSWLLNATSIEDKINRNQHPAVGASVINYGVPAFAGSYKSEKKWSDVDAIIRRAIVDFEPRLLPESLVISPVTGGGEKNHNVLAFEIRGLLYMQPYPTEFTAQSSLDLETGLLNFK